MGEGSQETPKDDKEEKIQKAEKDDNLQTVEMDEKKQKLVEMSKVSLWLDTYDDIFSDFDPRPYSQRTLSDDFLSEAKKESREKRSGRVELKLLIPINERNVQQEKIIKTRLKGHFNKQFNSLKKKMKDTIKQGLFFSVLGVTLMLITTIILFESNEKTIFMTFLVVLLEPAGWFLFWHGLDGIIFESKEIKPELAFYEKMSKCTIYFLSY